MNILICLIIIAVAGILLMKRYQPQPILIGMGILMMYIAYEGNWINAILDESQSQAFWCLMRWILCGLQHQRM